MVPRLTMAGVSSRHALLSRRRLLVTEQTPADWRFTDYFRETRQRPDRASIAMEWIFATAAKPQHRERQSDGRLRCWRQIPEFGNRWLRVVLLSDGRTIHNAFFDRGFVP